METYLLIKYNYRNLNEHVVVCLNYYATASNLIHVFFLRLSFPFLVFHYCLFCSWLAVTDISQIFLASQASYLYLLTRYPIKCLFRECGLRPMILKSSINYLINYSLFIFQIIQQFMIIRFQNDTTVGQYTVIFPQETADVIMKKVKREKKQECQLQRRKIIMDEVINKLRKIHNDKQDRNR